jgi:phosphoglycolate phosphatase
MLAAGSLAAATIVFDLDGTLVDTAPDLLRALQKTFDLEGLPYPSAAQFRRMVGRGARNLMEQACAQAGANFSDARLAELTAAYLAFYRDEIAVESRPYPGLEAVLDQLAEAGAKLAVCTNKRTDLAVALLEALKLAGRFSAVVGADAVPACKPHPDHFRHAVAKACGTMRGSIMVGDSAPDVISAKSAGAPAIIVRFGYSSDPVELLGADAIISRYEELAEVVTRLLARVR